MNNKRRRHSADFKFRVALEAAKGQKTTSQLSQEYGIHPTQISTWKRKLLSEGAEVFHRGKSVQEKDQAKREVELYEQIGRLKMELEWLKKKAALFD